MKSKPLNIPGMILLVGYIGILVLFLNSGFSSTVWNLPQPWGSIYAMICAVICFSSTYFSKDRTYIKNERVVAFLSFLPWYGLAETGFAVFLALTDPNATNVRFGVIINYYISMLGYMTAYLAVITSLFPNSLGGEKSVTRLNSVAKLSKDVQEIIHEGQTLVGTATVSALGISFGLIAISMFFLGKTESPLIFVGIEVLAAFLITFIARYIAVQRWQKQARQSGISEKKLASAAKVANLPWPGDKG